MFDKILVPLDGSPEAEQALKAVQAIDSEFQSDVVLLLVSPTEGALSASLAEGFGAGGSVAAAMERERTLHELGEAYLTSVRDTMGDESWSVQVRTGSIEATIREVAEEIDADLIVVASHTRSGIRRMLMGSVAEDVLRHSQRPVLTIPIHPMEDEKEEPS
ncbi:MAG: universal stress protein [Dehalococcoidia bacterium]|nr:universal stress protein [Dehalococcoidia bacterium]